MKFAVSAAAVFLLCLQGLATTDAAECPKHCTQEMGADNKVLCDCCNKGPDVYPIHSPCDSTECMSGNCVNAECEFCTDGVSAYCKPDCGKQPSTCPDGHLLVRDGADCNFCRQVGKDIIDPCADAFSLQMRMFQQRLPKIGTFPRPYAKSLLRKKLMNPKACNAGEECIRRDVQCAIGPCPPLKECYKTDCPPLKCPWGCYQYEKKDGCKACKCCKYELE